MSRETMEFDVVIVGAGPSGLASAIKLRQLAQSEGRELSVCVVEKGSELGAHSLAGTLLEPRALNELIPDWKERGAPINLLAARDEAYVLLNEDKSFQIPNFFVPRNMHNDGNYIISLGNFVRWLGEQ